MVLSHGGTACTVGKIFIRIILNFNAFTINLQKQFIECLGKAQGKGKKKALPIPPNHLPSSWTAVPLCPPTIVIWIVQRILFIHECVCPQTTVLWIGK